MCFLFTMLDNPPDLLREKIAAKLVLSFEDDIGPAINHLVEPDGIEPTTSCLQSTRSPN